MCVFTLVLNLILLFFLAFSVGYCGVWTQFGVECHVSPGDVSKFVSGAAHPTTDPFQYAYFWDFRKKHRGKQQYRIIGYFQVNKSSSFCPKCPLVFWHKWAFRCNFHAFKVVQSCSQNIWDAM